ncbi:HDOD domain-containing protein [Thiomicrorhabdus aquaedulcis]|uniref:HDOD domain-containing protein n=1 Tax=Thiomicrorhabdus aquaedulcis TaxID=2211106 RepID=UPI0022B2A742|nr:HDOD domain-containing protein [Thiomicrorhabdus aquaedulcis]
MQDIGRTEAYFVSFLQDIGAIYMMRYDSEHYAEHYLNAQLGLPLSGYLQEYEHYQTAHTFLGSVVARRWHLGDILAKSLLLHHGDSLQVIDEYDPKVAKMVALIQAANALVYDVFSDHYTTHEVKQTLHDAIAYLNLPENAIESAKAALQKWGQEPSLFLASH